MKHVVSISLGSSKRDHKVRMELLGQEILIERIGTNGDTRLFQQLCSEFDGKADAIGYGGMTENVKVGNKVYPLISAQKLIAHIKKTPVCDGSALKDILERRLINPLKQIWGDDMSECKVLMTVALDRYGMAEAFAEAGCKVVFGDLMFSLGIGAPIYTLKGLGRLAAVLMPLVGRFPVSWLYPTGEKQDVIKPKWTEWYVWADVIAGDFNYIKRHMPSRLDNKIIVTNTTTADDVKELKERGVAFLLTSTPVLSGRTFGTNVMEGVLVALAEKKRKLSKDEFLELLDRVGWEPQLRALRED